jgi:hypothetical protein
LGFRPQVRINGKWIKGKGKKAKKVLTIYPYYPFTLYPISLRPIPRILGGVLIGEERYVS